ncbi:MAG: helix-turn-helix transcriptional regulator [Gemmatimonadaceae bacterium]
MVTVNGSMLGPHSARRAVLVALKRSQPITAAELAKQFHVTPNALRRHLKTLEAEGVVRYRREVRGVGGPVYAYTLTESGEELFPRAYEEVLTAALDAVQEDRGVDGVVALFERRWSAIAERIRPQMAGLPLPERARAVAEVITSHGYMADVEIDPAGEATIHEHNCAIRAVAERYPEVCAAEARFLEDVLGAVVERRAHLLDGCTSCTYTVNERPRVAASENAMKRTVRTGGAVSRDGGENR